jgi:hypothetical protein
MNKFIATIALVTVFATRVNNAGPVSPEVRDIQTYPRNTRRRASSRQSTEQGSQSWNATGQVNDP